jgi:hypothetical protein
VIAVEARTAEYPSDALNLVREAKSKPGAPKHSSALRPPRYVNTIKSERTYRTTKERHAWRSRPTNRKLEIGNPQFQQSRCLREC